jgi:hypothetical protein
MTTNAVAITTNIRASTGKRLRRSNMMRWPKQSWQHLNPQDWTGHGVSVSARLAKNSQGRNVCS